MTFTGKILKPILNLIGRARRPKLKGTLEFKGLKSKVTIHRDRWGVPHIYAENNHDLFYAQGIVHAQDRLFQMEFNRRMVAGRLSEVFGKDTLPVDRWMRILSMRRVAEKEVNLVDKETHSLLEAYAAGVTACMEREPLPIEFLFLKHKPEPWQVADTLSWIKMMSWYLSVNWETELTRSQLINKVGEETFAELEPGYLDIWPKIVPDGVDFSKIGSIALEKLASARPFSGPSPTEGMGSNNWVIHGSRTNTGMPLLANDMHLGMSIPSIWYENHLVSSEFNVTGVVFPGIPGVISGHNGHVAWGYTNGFPDVQDLYMEKLRRTENGKIQADYKGDWYDCNVVREEIRIKGGETVEEEVVYTRHGPVINQLSTDVMPEEQPLALRWVSIEPDTMVQSFLEMIRAKDCHSFHKALRFWAAPVQNIVYADIHGDIGYSFPGKIPVRAKGKGLVPVPGWTDEYEWLGYIPFEDLPHFVNPEQRYIVTANNKVVGDEYPYFLGWDFVTGGRAQRIEELIENAPDGSVSMQSIQKMQFDQVSPFARRVGKVFDTIAVKSGDPLEEVLRLMKGWQGDLSADSPQAAVYQMFYRRLLTLLLDDSLGDMLHRYMGKGSVPFLVDISMMGERAEEWLVNLLDSPDARWWRKTITGTQENALKQALADSLKYLQEELGPTPADWSWGKLHALHYNHTLGAVPMLRDTFDRGPYPLGGDFNTVWATGAMMHLVDTEVENPPGVIGPPYRMIVDLGNLDNSISLLAPGQSGRPDSPHYDDQINNWFQTTGYKPMLYSEERVLAESRHRLELKPG